MHPALINEDVYAAPDEHAGELGTSHSEEALAALGRLVAHAAAERNAGRHDAHSLSDLDTSDGSYARWRAGISALPTFVAGAVAVVDDLAEYEDTPEFVAALEGAADRLPAAFKLFGEEGARDGLVHLATLLGEALGKGDLSGAATYAEIALGVIDVCAPELESIADPRQLLERTEVQRAILSANYEGARRELRAALSQR